MRGLFTARADAPRIWWGPIQKPKMIYARVRLAPSIAKFFLRRDGADSGYGKEAPDGSAEFIAAKYDVTSRAEVQELATALRVFAHELEYAADGLVTFADNHFNY